MDKFRIINGFHLKIIAILAMVVDHIAWCIFTEYSVIMDMMHFIGRVTLPMMCFLLVEGFLHTKNIIKYLIRLLAFAIISQPFFYFFKYDYDEFLSNPYALIYPLNILFTLFIALFCLFILSNKRIHIYIKFVLILLGIYASMYMDWQGYVIIFTLVLFLSRKNRYLQIFSYCVAITIILILIEIGAIYGISPISQMKMSYGLFIPPLFWLFYNSEQGSKLLGKDFFYWFYPVHLFLISFFFKFNSFIGF